MQKEKKDDKSLAFAKGICRLSNGEGDSLELDFALKGFIKPDKVKKNKKKLFMKMGVTLKDVIKGTLEEINEVAGGISSDETENVEVEEKPLDEEDTKSILVAANKYVKANKKMKQIILPLLKSKTAVIYTQTHIELAKAAYTALTAFLEVCEKKEDKKPGILDKKPKLKTLRDSILDNSLKEKYLKIWKKVKLEYNKEVETLSEEENAKISRVETLLKEISELEAQQAA